MSLSPLPLSYCTNVHPGRTLADVEAGLDRYTVPVQRALGRPVGAGLWLAQPVVEELFASPQNVPQFAERLLHRGLTCYTLNAFPYGDFHKARVKEQVYLPDWSDPTRTLYTERCGVILSGLMPDSAEGSISTLPLGFKPFNHEVGFLDACVEQLLGVAAGFAQLREKTGKTIRLAIEPEPFCLIETTAETIDFFNFLWRAADKLGLEPAARKHLGVCYDVCHQAVEFEDAAASIALLDAAGIRINKVQISCALELADPAARETLRQFIEPRYLHQTMARTSLGHIAKSVDLDDALLTRPTPEFTSAAPWRVHFHVPVSAERMGTLGTTRAAIPQALRAIAALDYAPHLEVETYTWDVLPGSPVDLVTGLTEELRATHDLLRDVAALNR
jgi:sugar phosphate isomerase/epimerase